jgi:hypothetical protein
MASATVAVLVARSAAAVDHRLRAARVELAIEDGAGAASAGRREIGFRVAESLLGAGDELGFRRAAGLVELATTSVGRSRGDIIRKRGQAEIEIAPYIDHGSAKRRSLAANPVSYTQLKLPTT